MSSDFVTDSVPKTLSTAAVNLSRTRDGVAVPSEQALPSEQAPPEQAVLEQTMPLDTDDSNQGFGVQPPVLGKPPQPVIEGVMAFQPNRATLGGTAYLITTPEGNVLVDSPPWSIETQKYLGDRGVRWLFLTHRNAMAQVKAMQAALDCEILVQEQEAYLLPDLVKTTFGRELNVAPGLTAIWTAGYSPGSTCLHWNEQGGVLFTGRHLLPTRQSIPRDQSNSTPFTEAGIAPLRTSKTFHWPRQLRAVQLLQERFSEQNSLTHLCPGASIGFLRGDRSLNQASQRLQAIDLESLAKAPIGP